MNSQKPKKAFRNLFTKTESDNDEASLNLDFNARDQKSDKKLFNLNESKTLIQDIQLHSLEADKIKNHIPETLTTIVEESQNLGSIIKEPSPNDQNSAHSVEKKSNPYSFVKIQYNLDNFKAERNLWTESDYTSFINKIDQAQTDAFFLKGRLVSEIKEKFYLHNKKGWALFCEESLNMNYTTANQYIRVSQEFDVTSHHRKDFGFEHFKALLPLTIEARNEIINHTPGNMSVKSLRTIVAKRLLGTSFNHENEKKPVTSKSIVETLQKLKTQLGKIKNISLSQEEKWQLYGAFQNLSEEMTLLSNNFSSPVEIKSEITVNN